MADAIDRLIRVLEDRFEAEVGSEERIAASDLALSLQQDQTLRSALPRGGPLVARSDEVTFEVGFIGSDFVADRTRQIFLRLDDAVLMEAASGFAPKDFEGSLIDALRQGSRRRVQLSVRTANGTFVGVMERVGRDHVVLQQRTERKVFVPAASVRSVTCVLGD